MSGNIRYFGVEFVVCIDAVEQSNATGRVYSRCMKQPLPFNDIGAMLLELDDILDVRNFPQAYQTLRSFTDRNAAKERARQYAALKNEEGMSAERIAKESGAYTTVAIQVVTRRKASWQGQLTLADERTFSFNSVYTLLKLFAEHILPQPTEALHE